MLPFFYERPLPPTRLALYTSPHENSNSYDKIHLMESKTYFREGPEGFPSRA